MKNRLRKVPGGYQHFCPGCRAMHVIPDGWEFNGDYHSPMFAPSVKHTWFWGKEREPKYCHYFVRFGVIEFCDDCTHPLRGLKVKLPELPDWTEDDEKPD